MFSAHAAEFIDQGVFMLKMGLILAAGVNAAIFHSGPFTTRGALEHRCACAGIGPRGGGDLARACGPA